MAQQVKVLAAQVGSVPRNYIEKAGPNGMHLYASSGEAGRGRSLELTGQPAQSMRSVFNKGLKDMLHGDL